MALVDTGLLVRYYFDEASSGDPATVEDLSGNNYDLTATGSNVAANMEYAEVSGNRGVDCSSTTGNQRLKKEINDTSDAVRDAMASTKTATIEVVLRADAFNSSGSRIFGINGRAGQNGECIFKALALNNGVFSWDDTDRLQAIDFSGARQVIHITIDTALATDRMKVYIDNVLQTGGTDYTVVSDPSQDSTLSLGSSLDLIAFNRESSGSFDRSWNGCLFYAALYNHALSAAEVEQNYDILTADDDAPVVAGGHPAVKRMGGVRFANRLGGHSQGVAIW